MNMDESMVVAFLERDAARLQAEFGLPHWRITTRVKALVDGTRAQVETDAPYERATIEFDPAQFKDDETLKSCYEHELIHCVLAPFDLGMFAAKEWIPDGPARESFDRAWRYAEEQAVRNVERLVFKLREVGRSP
jgi:hypothetical protein